MKIKFDAVATGGEGSGCCGEWSVRSSEGILAVAGGSIFVAFRHKVEMRLEAGSFPRAGWTSQAEENLERQSRICWFSCTHSMGESDL